jgi:hypothetical protein
MLWPDTPARWRHRGGGQARRFERLSFSDPAGVADYAGERFHSEN